MSFVSRLRPDRIALAPPWRTFTDTVEGLLDLLVASGACPPAAKADVLHAVRAREAEGSTAALDSGVGVPHARIAAVTTPVVALAVCAAGLYEAVPTVPMRIVALVLSPPTSIEEHLRILSDVATLLRSSDLRASLLRAPDPYAALDVLSQYSRGAG